MPNFRTPEAIDRAARVSLTVRMEPETYWRLKQAALDRREVDGMQGFILAAIKELLDRHEAGKREGE